jgi:hypothetical protein
MSFELPGVSNLLKLSETSKAMFHKPWHATAFALVIARLERYLVNRATALEAMVADRKLTSYAELQRFRNALLAAAERTSHPLFSRTATLRRLESIAHV